MAAEAGGPIARLIEELGKLPGIGPKTAERLTHHLLARSRAEVYALADALRAVKDSIRLCRQGCNLTEGDLCAICTDPRRDASLICVVEQPRDLAALERAATYRGHYHVLHGRLAPLEGVGPEQLTIDGLRARDHFVFDVCRARRVPVVVVMAGGYANDVGAIVTIHANTIREAVLCQEPERLAASDATAL